MKTLKTLSLFAALFVFVGSVPAQETPKTQPPKATSPHKKDDKKEDKKDELPTKGEYDRALKHYTEWKTKFNDPDHWKNVTLTRVSDKKEFKVKDLEDFDRQGFYLSNLRRASFEMTRMDGFWQKELKDYTAKPPTQEGVPTPDELKVYIEKLTKLRKETAVVLEDYAAKFVKDNGAKITKDEGDLLLKQIKDYHDENKLIERKK